MLEVKKPQKSTSKRDRLRTEIRRATLRDRFNEQRSQLISHIDFRTLKNLLSDIDTPQLPTHKQMAELITILEENCQKADFNLQVGGQNLEEHLAQLLLTHAKHLELKEKQSILSALAFITYYNSSCCESLAGREEFVDLLRLEVGALNLQSLEQIEILREIVVLLMNLSSQCRKEFSLYLAESDICRSLLRQISHTTNIAKHQNCNYETATVELRGLVLRFLKNVFMGLQEESLSLAVQLTTTVLEDDAYFLEQPALSFHLLTAGMNLEGFLQEVSKTETLSSQVINASDAIQMRCFSKSFLQDKDESLNEFEFESFPYLLKFFNSLFQNDQQNYHIELTWTVAVQNLLNGYMLAQFLLKSQHRRKKPDVLLALETYQNLSESDFVTSKQLVTVRPSQDQSALLKLWLDPSLMSCHQASAMCFTILRNILIKDQKYHSTLMELNIIEVLCQVLEKNDNIRGILAGISLAQSLLSKSEGQQQRMLEVLDSRGVTKLIDGLAQNNNRQVFLRAQMFNQKYASIWKEKKER